MPQPPKIRHFSVRVPDDIIRAFRAICIHHGVSSQAAIQHYMRGVIDGTASLPRPGQSDEPEPPDEP